MARPKRHPIFIARELGSMQFCGHQHRRVTQARNCGHNRWLNSRVYKVDANGDERRVMED